MTDDSALEERLTAWLHTQIVDADKIAVEGLDRVTFGHSAEMMVLTIVSSYGGRERRQEVVLRLRPTPPALLEPYDLARQYTVMHALQDTPVRAPKALWLEDSGDVLGRPFLIMERVGGDVFEMDAPQGSDELIATMCRSLVEQLAAIHAVDLEASGLGGLDDGADHLGRELQRWAGEMHRVKNAPLPALELLLDRLQATKPAQSPRITLVHGDAKPGNFAFTDGAVSAVFDWEMATVGDPLSDIGWLEMLWQQPVGITSHPGALTIDELITHYEIVSGITVTNRSWYRALNAFKMAVICLVGAMLVDQGHSDDQKLALAAYGTALLTAAGLTELGVNDKPEDGPVLPRQERIDALLAPSARAD